MGSNPPHGLPGPTFGHGQRSGLSSLWTSADPPTSCPDPALQKVLCYLVLHEGTEPHGGLIWCSLSFTPGPWSSMALAAADGHFSVLLGVPGPDLSYLGMCVGPRGSCPGPTLPKKIKTLCRLICWCSASFTAGLCSSVYWPCGTSSLSLGPCA